MSYPAPTRAEHDKFCTTEGWTRVRDSQGRTGTHHVTYELALADGRILRTRISHPPDRSTYGPSIWSHILRDQLLVSQEELWDCVRGGTKPARSTPEQRPAALPADLVHQLIARFQVPEDEVAAMTKPEAIARLQELWSQEI